MVDPVVGGLTDPFNDIHMGVTAENLAESHAICREEQDEFSVESHQRAARAQEEGRSTSRSSRSSSSQEGHVEFDEDEHVRPDAIDGGAWRSSSRSSSRTAP